MKDNITEAENKVCGVTSGRRRKERETWWNAVVQQVIRDKKITEKSHESKEEDEYEYQEKKGQARREMAKPKREALEK